MRIVALDQVDLPLPVPALELLFSQYRAFHVSEHLEAYEPIDCVAAGESRHAAGTMLVQTAKQVGCDAYVKRAIWSAAQDVDAGLLIHDAADRVAKWMLKQVQHDG